MKSPPLFAVIFLLIFIGVSMPATSLTSEAERYLEELLEEADSQKLADAPQWHALLHYRTGLFGGVESDIDSPEFFVHDDGATEPQAELEAMLTALFDSDAESFQCRFPARYAWLDDRLGFDTQHLDRHDCRDFESWRDLIDAESATLIFAASYMNNPASMFGHTLMRLNRGGDDQSTELDSYVVNVTAEPWTHNPVLYIAMGMSGGFDGIFATIPFDRKVQKYTDRERREMWEYELNFDDPQLQRMIRHLWELRPVNVDYRYFDENCSYFLMSLLQVADPSLEVVDEFRFLVLPGQMIRAVLDVEGLTEQRHFRPSSRQLMRATTERLESDETELAQRLAIEEDDASLDDLDDFEEMRRALILDAALALWRYRNPPTEEGDDVERGWQSALQQRRDGLDVSSPPLVPRVETAPEDGHGPARLTLSGGLSPDSSGHFELGIRPAFHDLAASAIGHAPLSQLEVLNLRIRAPQLDAQLQWPELVLQQLDIVNLISLSPVDQWSKNWSWSIKTGFERAYRSGCGETGCLIYDAAAGFGGAAEFGPLATYFLVDGQLAFGSTFDHNVRLAAGPRLGTLLHIGGHAARLHIEGRYRYPLWGEGFPALDPAIDDTGPPWSTRATLSFSPTQNLELRAGALAARNQMEANFELHLYF